MSARIQVVLDEHERESFRAAAQKAGMSLSAWMRGCAREKLAEAAERQLPRTAEELRRFFAECDEREEGREPDWEEQRRVIERAATSGRADS
jgi:hypothetical protein